MPTAFPERISAGYLLLASYTGLAEVFTYFQTAAFRNIDL